MDDGAIDVIVIGPDTELSRLVLELARSRRLRGRRLSFEHIVKDAVIDDWLDVQGAGVRWTFRDREFGTLSPQEARGVLCYGDVPDRFRDDIADDDADYVHHEITAYFGFALSRCPNVINQPFAGALTGYTDTLPYQWSLVATQSWAGLSVPVFDVANRPTPRAGVIHSNDFYSYTEWDSAAPPPGAERAAVPQIYLRYERPPGDPCLVWFVDNAFIAIDPGTGEQTALGDVESDLTTKLIDLFRAECTLRLGQILLFRSAEDGGMTFGSVAPWLSFWGVSPLVRTRFACEVLESLVPECTNR